MEYKHIPKAISNKRIIPLKFDLKKNTQLKITHREYFNHNCGTRITLPGHIIR